MSKIYTVAESERRDMIGAAKAELGRQGVTLSPSNLAAHLECSECTIQRWLNELGDEGREGVRSRLDPDTRKAGILTAAMDEASAVGFDNMTRRGIAKRAGVSEPLVNKYLGTLKQLRRTVMRQAVKHEMLPVIAQGLAARNQYALHASKELQALALASLSGG